MDGRPWREEPGGVLLTVRVTPRGGRDGVDGREVLADGKAVLKVRVRSAPTDGAANEAVRRLIAATVARPASAVRLASGATARVKTLAIAGDPAGIVRALETAAGQGQGS
jgi:uncharacterized protein YggU (UPF0235/DUF167 family)